MRRMVTTKEIEEMNKVNSLGKYIDIDEEDEMFTIGWKLDQWDGYIEFTPNGVCIQGPGGASILIEEQWIVFGWLPTSDPGVAGALWNDNGTLKISAGE